MKLAARRYDTQACVQITLEGDRLVSLSEIEQDPSLLWVAPSFIDLQVNGYNGIGFNDPQLTLEQIATVSQQMEAFGVTRYLPTLTTDSLELLSRSLALLAQAMAEIPAVRSRVPGIHLEGPFICAEDGPRGAHPRQHVLPADWETFCRLQEAASGAIRLLTLSPEYPQAPEVISRAVATGVVVAIGHTQANSAQIRAAVDAGATLSTHLGNGAHPLLRRHPNYIWDQLAEDRLWASLIVDGHHLPAAVVKAMVRAKTPQRCILVSDKTNLGGLPTGVYSTPLGEVELLPEGKLVVAGQREILAGAALPITVNIAKVMEFAELDLRTAVAMASIHPAQLMGWESSFLQPNKPANLVFFRYEAGEIAVERIVAG